MNFKAEHPLNENIKENSMRFIWENPKHSYDYEDAYNKIYKLCDNYFDKIDLTGFRQCYQITSFSDIVLLKCIVKHFNISNVLEIGCGRTTTALSQEDVNCVSFTITDMTPEDGKRKNSVVHLADARSPKVMEEMRKLLPTVDMVLIDGPHSYEFAKNYIDNLLVYAKDKIVWIHDHYSYDRPFVNGEDFCTKEMLVNKTHKLWLLTDSLGYVDENKIDKLCEIVNFKPDIVGKNDWNAKSGVNGIDGPTLQWVGMCAAVLVPLDYKE